MAGIITGSWGFIAGAIGTTSTILMGFAIYAAATGKCFEAIITGLLSIIGFHTIMFASLSLDDVTHGDYEVTNNSAHTQQVYDVDGQVVAEIQPGVTETIQLTTAQAGGNCCGQHMDVSTNYVMPDGTMVPGPQIAPANLAWGPGPLKGIVYSDATDLANLGQGLQGINGTVDMAMESVSAEVEYDMPASSTAKYIGGKDPKDETDVVVTTSRRTFVGRGSYIGDRPGYQAKRLAQGLGPHPFVPDAGLGSKVEPVWLRPNEEAERGWTDSQKRQVASLRQAHRDKQSNVRKLERTPEQLKAINERYFEGDAAAIARATQTLDAKNADTTVAQPPVVMSATPVRHDASVARAMTAGVHSDRYSKLSV